MESMESIEVASFYRFSSIPEERLSSTKEELEKTAREHSVRGLLILASEGVNGTFAGDPTAVRRFQDFLPNIFGDGGWDFKQSRCDRPPFRSFRVKLRPEIVTTRSQREIRVDGMTRKLSPADWHQAMLNFPREDAILIDTRNAYETQIGIFEGAVDPGLNNFQEFEEYVTRSQIPKDKKIYMYCTGGIRCEKASIQMEKLGYSEVYQLEGGILRYLEQFPNQTFKGECFVFDNRVSLDQQLKPSQTWSFCPHCGDPAKTPISCSLCGCSAKVCDACLGNELKHTCSKDCEHRLSRKLAKAMSEARSDRNPADF